MTKQKQQAADASPDSILILIDYLYTLGVDADEWLRDDGIDLSILENPESRIAANMVADIWRTALRRTGDDNLGLHVGLNFPSMKGHIIAILAANSPTLGEAFKNLCEYHDILSEDPQLYLEYKDDKILLGVNRTTIDAGTFRHISECMFSAILVMLYQMLRKKISPIVVYFSHAKPNNSADHEAFFQCPILFNQDITAIVFSADDMTLPVPFADSEFLKTVKDHAQKKMAKLKQPITWTEKVASLLATFVPKGCYDINTVATELTVSTRKLQQKLCAEQTTFQKILDSVRKDIAVDVLENSNTSITELALLLGFSEQSAFNHAFKRWTGKTPNQNRRQ